MQVDLSQNYFELFGLPVQFAVDDAVLVQRFQELQKQLHPDRYASRPAAERRWSMQAASHVNEAYQALRQPLPRAIYLLGLNGVSVDEETDTRMDPEFLMEQMEYREALEMAEAASEPLGRLDELRRQLKSATAGQSESYAAAVENNDWDRARTLVRQWQFLDKLTREVRDMEERLDA